MPLATVPPGGLHGDQDLLQLISDLRSSNWTPDQFSPGEDGSYWRLGVGSAVPNPGVIQVAIPQDVLDTIYGSNASQRIVSLDAELELATFNPPLLIDNNTDFAIAEMPAIVLYLGETLDLLPATPELRALTMKIVCDANDVIDEITLQGGMQMWTDKRWEEFVPRLKKWMSFWEETGRRHGLKADSGFLLGGDVPGIADVVTATLWSTMTDRFRKIDTIFKRTAPTTAQSRSASVSRMVGMKMSQCELTAPVWCILAPET